MPLNAHIKSQIPNFTAAESRLGIDCLSLPVHFSGAANYIYYLTVHLLGTPRTVPLTIFCKTEHRHLFSECLEKGDKIITVPLKNRAAQLFFYEFQLKRQLIQENIAVFYATHYLTPPRDIRYFIVNTFHDAGFVLFPHFYPWIKRIYFGQRMETFLKRADVITAVSHSTADSLAQTFPAQAHKIKTVYSGINHFSGKPAGTERLFSAHRKITDRPYILAVNTLESRKNIPFIITVFNALKARFKIPHKLVIVGHPANGYRKILKTIRESSFKNDIILTNFVSTDELINAYRYCDFFISASIYEGFGFTPFEAIFFERPVFLYQNNAIAEFLGDHPYLFNHFDATVWAERIWQESRSGFKNKITFARIAHLTWQNTAAQVLKICTELMTAGEEKFVR